MDAEDAALAAKSGADALIVSNHGGRQLDGADSSIALLPEIVSAVGKDIEVWMDGGIRSGQDVLNILHKELDMTMALCGHRDIHNVDRSILRDCPF